MMAGTGCRPSLIVHCALLYNSFMMKATEATMAAEAAARTPRERMAALADAQPLPVLCATLLAIDAEPEPTEADRLARAVTIDAITARCPAARAALEEWAGDVKDPRTTTQVVIDAVTGA